MDIDKSIEALLSGKGSVRAPANLRQSIETGLQIRKQRRRLLSYTLAIGAIAALLLLTIVPPAPNSEGLSDQRLAAIADYVDGMLLDLTDTTAAADTSYFLFSTTHTEDLGLFDYESQSTPLISM